jgi:hypothetical protein
VRHIAGHQSGLVLEESRLLFLEAIEVKNNGKAILAFFCNNIVIINNNNVMLCDNFVFMAFLLFGSWIMGFCFLGHFSRSSLFGLCVA